MTVPILSSGLLTSALLLFTVCIVDVGRSAASTSATGGRPPPWAVTLRHQSSIAGSGLHEIDESDLRSGDLFFSSSLGTISLGTRAFSTSSASYVALYLGEGQITEAIGAGVQVISVQQVLAHSDKLFALRVPDLTSGQAMAMRNFTWQVKDSGCNYRGTIQSIPYAVTESLCSLNPFLRNSRQQCVSGLAKAQLGDAASTDKKAWFCSESVSEVFVRVGHPLTLVQATWISPSDLLRMREGGAATFRPETQLQYAGHLKLGVYLQAGKLVGPNKPKDNAE